MTSALFIGRFQPFHLGHLSVIKKALSEVDFLIIAIGSAEDSYLPENPFTAGERIEMIKASLEGQNLDPSKYIILPIRNINNYALWCHHVKLLTPPFQVVYTGSSLVKKLFEAEQKYKIREVVFEVDICATKIREKMITGKEWWQDVPEAVAERIKKLDGEARIKTIMKI